MKKFFGLILLFLTHFAFANFIDHGDLGTFPNVNVDSHIRKIVKQYYPCIDKIKKERGLSRKEAFTKDIREVSKGLNIPDEELIKFTKFVINPSPNIIIAPHTRLKEFELYARGKLEYNEARIAINKLRKIYIPETITREDEIKLKKAIEIQKTVPSMWKKLLSLPKEQRRYTTIPVIYNLIQFGHLEYFFEMMNAFSDNMEDSQNCVYSYIKSTPCVYNKSNISSPEYKIHLHKELLKYVLTYPPQKIWRYVNEFDDYSCTVVRGESFFGGYHPKKISAVEKDEPVDWNLNNALWMIYIQDYENLEKLLKKDELSRDIIIAVGLTNREIKSTRNLADKYWKKSTINYEIKALRLGYPDAIGLLDSKSPLLKQLEIRALKGKEKIDAINSYLANYPDYMEKDMPITSIALKTHKELKAIKAAEMLKLGQIKEAFDIFIEVGSVADVSIIAEQILSTQELLEYCKEHINTFSYSAKQLYEDDCARHKPIANIFYDRERINLTIRNILARKLMREGDFDEASKWFSGQKAEYVYGLFEYFSDRANNISLSKNLRFAAQFQLAALIRFEGMELMGTQLEPDNYISLGRYKNEWGINPESGVKHLLNKPNLPRFHYRNIAVKEYIKAAELAPTDELKAICYVIAARFERTRTDSFSNFEIYLSKLKELDCTIGKYIKVIGTIPTILDLKSIYPEIDDWYNRRFILPADNKFPIIKRTLSDNERTRKVNEKFISSIYKAEIEIEKFLDERTAISMRMAAEYEVLFLGRLTNSYMYLMQGLELFPNDTGLLHQLAYCYLDLGYSSKAIKIFEVLVDNDQLPDQQMMRACEKLVNYFRNSSVYHESQEARVLDMDKLKKYFKRSPYKRELKSPVHKS